MSEPQQCIRCAEAPALGDDGYCGHCHWAVRAEIDEGFYLFGVYLRHWAAFHAWEEEHSAT